ncbi:MAG: DsbE family thiol:disulfide interchange protein [Pseudomonadota bacterium]
MTETPAHEVQSDERKNRSSWLLVPVIIFAAMAIMFMFALQSGDPSKLPSALLGKPVPKFKLAPLDGLKDVPGFGSAELGSGGAKVVNFWASWCGPCRDEHPMLEALKREGKAKMFGINYKDPPPGGQRFLAQYGNPFGSIGVDATGRVAIDWGVYGMPETFVVDGQGRIVYKHVGPISAKDLEEKIRPAIAAANSGATRRQ